MSGKTAFIDLDGTVCNVEKRFAHAWQQGRIDWSIAFHPPLLELDELIAGSEAALEKFEQDGWEIIFLSSRPETLRRATRDWLRRHDLLHGQTGEERRIILKPSQHRWTNTPRWKAEIVCATGLNRDEVVVVDDAGENLVAIRGMWRSKGLNRSGLTTYKSFELASQPDISG